MTIFPKAFIVGSHDQLVYTMFLQNDWSIITDDESADLIVFTGGNDITPSYYNRPKHPSTTCYPERDAMEFEVFNRFKGKKPMAGICRGGQLLHVANGGVLWQDVNGHGAGKHMAFDHVNEEDVLVSSVHHQMMMDHTTPRILMSTNISSWKRSGDPSEDESTVAKAGDQSGLISEDIEALIWEDMACLCFQPHPEYRGISNGNQRCQELFFEYINNLLGV